MPTNTLTDARCKGAKATDKPYKLFDGGGLFLFVSSTGGKSWRHAYRFAGKPQTITYGPYPEVSLADARKRRDEVKAMLRAGEDPMAQRREAKNRQKMTLRAAANAYWNGRQDLSPGYVANALAGITNHLGELLDKDVGEIDREALITELARMDARGLFSYVRKVRMWSGQVFEWCVEHDLMEINPAPLIRPEKAFGKRKTQHFASLPLNEVPEFLERLSLEQNTQAVIACRLLAITWVRTGELRLMEECEVDFQRRLWVIPASKMKRDRDHHVPLTDQAIAIIRDLQARKRPNARYLFGHPSRLDRPMSENAVLSVIYRLGYKGRMTGHGWRTAASTWANEHGFSPDAIERQLSHKPGDQIRAVYNRAEYLTERREIMQAWANWLDGFGLTPA